MVYLFKITQMTCLLTVGKFPNTVSELMQWALSTVETWCNEVRLLVIPDKTGLVAFTRKRKPQGFFGVKLSLLGSVKYMGVILESWLTWREHVKVKVRKAHNLLWACSRACRAGSQGGPLALCRHHLADHLLCILSMVAWLPNGYCQEAKQSTKTGMLRDNRSDLYSSYWCYGGARWPPSAGSGDKGGCEVGGTPPLEFGLVLPSPPTRTQLHIDLTSEV